MPIKDINGNIIQRGILIIERYCFEVLDFQRRILANGGNRLSNNELNALDIYIKNLKIEGLWSNLIGLYPFVGGNGGSGSLASFSVNLISSSYNLTGIGVGNALCTSLGYTGSGSMWITNINALSVLTSGDNYLSFYSRTVTGTANQFDMSAFTSSTSRLDLLAGFGSGNGSIFSSTYNDATALSYNNPIADNGRGYHSVSIKSGTRSLYKNGLLLLNSAVIAGTLPNRSIILGAYDSGPSFYSNKNYTHFSIGGGYTSAQELVRYKIQQTFETMLGRQV